MNKKVFFIKLLVFIVLVVVTDICTTSILEKLYYSCNRGGVYTTNYILNTTKADIVTFGSSTVSHAFIPQIIEDSLCMSCYNAGRDGQGVLFGYSCFIYMIERHVPEIIIIDIGEGDIIKSSFSTNSTTASLFSPYYGLNSTADSLLFNNRFDKIKMLSGMYRYNSKLSAIFGGHSKSRDDETHLDRGYIPLYGNKDYIEKEEKYVKHEIDNNKLLLLENFIDLAIAHNCKVILTTAPRNIDSESNYFSYVNAISERKNIPYLNNYQNEIFLLNKQFFYDIAHLNHDGAFEYTKIVTSYIKNNMKNK